MPDASPEPGGSTLRTTDGVEHAASCRVAGPDLGQQLGLRSRGHLAHHAELAHEALRQHAEQRRREQIVLDAHLEQAGDGARRVVGVQRREHEVTGERRLDRDLGGLGVADLTDHDDVGILTHDRAQARSRT